METESDIPLYLYQLFLSAPAMWPAWAAFFGVIFLLICSGLISGSEVAFFSLSHNDFEALEEEKSGVAQRILRLKDQPRLLLATILISNNFVNISIVILSDFMLRIWMPETLIEHWAQGVTSWLGYGAEAVTQWANVLSFLITVVGVTFLLVLFGEVAPKVYATQNNIQIARIMSSPLATLSVLFKPLSLLLMRSTSLIEKRLAQRAKAGSQTSKEDIGDAIDLTVSREHFTGSRELDILHSIVKFSSVSVKQIMTPRLDIVGVENTATYKELLDIARESGYSRIPVFEEDLDQVVGLLYVKDLLGHLQDADFEWQSVIRTNMMYVPESKKIDDLLREFQKEHLHLAMVVDEYGGTAGLVTLEDIMEEIIGDIKDEFDDETDVVYQKIDDYNYLFEGKTLLNDLCRIIGVPVEAFDDVKGEADSLAGLLLELCGQFPRKDAQLQHNGFTFKIVSVTKRRIEQVRVTIHKSEA